VGDDVGLGDGVGLAAGGCVFVAAGGTPICCTVAGGAVVSVGPDTLVGLMNRDSGVGSVQASKLDKTSTVNNICDARLLII